MREKTKTILKVLVVGVYLVLLAFGFPINDKSIPEEHKLFPKDAEAKSCACKMNQNSGITIQRVKCNHDKENQQ